MTIVAPSVIKSADSTLITVYSMPGRLPRLFPIAQTTGRSVRHKCQLAFRPKYISRSRK